MVESSQSVIIQPAHTIIKLYVIKTPLYKPVVGTL